METVLGAFVAAGIAADDAATCLMTVHDYVIGFTIEQQAVISLTGERDPHYVLEVREARMDPVVYPLARSIGPALFTNPDAMIGGGGL